MTKFNIQGKGNVVLGTKDFLAQGGEGIVYAKHNTAYKIYCDEKGNPNPQKMINPNKISELSVIQMPQIIKPENLIYYQNKAIGYTMRYVKNTYPLCQLFTKSFKTRNNLQPEDMMDLVIKLQKIIHHVHQKGILIVDLNEMNFLTNNNFKDIYAIDVDSWQTKTFPATAIMESIRDRQVKNQKFTEESDWFSFAVVSFQMLIGVHPFKGKHPTIKEWMDRMDKGISVFNKDVKIPKICLPFDVIPNGYRNWYKAVFEDGKRLSPPTNPEDHIVIFTPKIQNVSGSHNFIIKELYEFDDTIVHSAFGINKCVSIVGDKIMIGRRQVYDAQHTHHYIIFSPNNQKPLVAWVDNGKLKIVNTHLKTEICIDINAQSAMICDGRLYIKNNTKLHEIQFKEIGTGIYTFPKQVGNLMNKASKLFDGVAIQNIMRKIYVNICPSPGVCHQIYLKELTKQKIVDAKYMNNVLMIITEKKGKYNRFVFRFDEFFASYDIREIKDILYTGLNFVVNQKGICVLINEEENVEIFTNQKDSSGVKVIHDDSISGDMKLITDGLNIYFSKDNYIYKFSMNAT